MKHDLSNTIERVLHYIGSPSTAQSAHAGQGVAGYVNPTFVVTIAAMAAASPNAEFNYILKECDTLGGSYTAVDADDMVVGPGGNATPVDGEFFTANSTSDAKAVAVTYKGTKPFIKVEVGITDEPSATAMAIVFEAVPSIGPAVDPTA